MILWAFFLAVVPSTDKYMENAQVKDRKNQIWRMFASLCGWFSVLVAVINPSFGLISLRLAIMIAQWENKCISLSVVSMARVMIAQWEN